MCNNGRETVLHVSMLEGLTQCRGESHWCKGERWTSPGVMSLSEKSRMGSPDQGEGLTLYTWIESSFVEVQGKM